MKRLKFWVEYEMTKRKWQEADFTKVSGMPYAEVKNLFTESVISYDKMMKTFKVFGGIAKAFKVPVDKVLYEAELYQENEQQPMSITKLMELIENLNEEQKDLIGKLAKQLLK